MSYNQYGASPYGRPPGFGSFSGQASSAPGMGSPPGMGPPPGMSAPGTAPPPGVQQAKNAQGNRPSGLPASFQGALNMPNINFSAPVIRLGTTGPKASTPLSAGGRSSIADPGSAGGPRLGLGAERGVDAQRQALRDTLMSLVPPTRDEIVRTIFVGGITDGCGGDDGIERLLSTAGRLRRWDRAIDADGKQCSFGFAQYEDAESLLTAVEVLKDIEIPTKRQAASDTIKTETPDDDEKIEKSSLLVFVDDNSHKYLENYQSNRGDDSTGEKARADAARAALKGVVHDLFHPPKFVKHEEGHHDTIMQDAEIGDNIEVVNIPIAVDDELADIPAEIRETVLVEIAAFRDRSTRRDIERLKREEEMEAAERQRNGAPRVSRLASPGPQIPSGPSGATNNIPLGPRGVPNAPSGPKGSQMPRDYQAGVKFVNGSGTNGAGGDRALINRDDEDDSASDSELEQRRVKKKEEEQTKQFLDQERRWLNREKSRTLALQREKEREDEDAANAQSQKEKMAQRFKDWDDEVEASKKTHEFYRDRSAWVQTRATFRSREGVADYKDREAQKREEGQRDRDHEQAGALADSFLDRQAEELGSRPLRMPTAQQPFKLSLGAAAQKSKKEAPARRTVAEVEGLLEDEEDDSKTSKRTLVPIKYDPNASSAPLTDEERDQAVRNLAAEIPNDKDGLWAWDITWKHVDEGIIVDKLRPFVEKKIVEYLGVQEQLLVEVVENHVKEHGKPQALVELLEGALDEEAEVLVKKLWRMVIFFSESEKRGLSA